MIRQSDLGKRTFTHGIRDGGALVMEDRRQFFRVHDSVYLRYRIIERQYLDQAILNAQTSAEQQRKLLQSMADIDENLVGLEASIKVNQPEIAQAIDLLKRKIDSLAGVVRTQLDPALSDKDGRTPQEISLSAGGLGFSSRESFGLGDMLDLTLVLLPEVKTVHGFGEIVDCQSEAEDQAEGGYRVGVQFTYLAEADREIIVAHVLNKQSRLLRESKEQGKSI